MADYAFPSTNDLGGGKTMCEAQLRDWLNGLMAAAGPFVVSGFVVPASSGSLSITIPLGVAYINGYRIEADAEAITVSAANTHYVYLQYSVDGGNNITAHGLVSNTTGVTPSRAILLCQLIAGGSSITSTIDRRRVGFAVNQGYQPQAIVHAAVPVGSVALVNVINVTEGGQLVAIYFDKANATVTGALAANLKIQIDGQTAFSEQILTNVAADPRFDGSLLLRFADTSGQTSKLFLYLYYRQSLKIDIDVTSAGSGTFDVYVLRAQGIQ